MIHGTALLIADLNVETRGVSIFKHAVLCILLPTDAIINNLYVTRRGQMVSRHGEIVSRHVEIISRRGEMVGPHGEVVSRHARLFFLACP